MRSQLARVQWGSLALLTIVWVMLMGQITFGNIVAGVLVASAVIVVFPLPPVATGIRPHAWGIVVLVARFLWDLTVASIQVGWLTVRPGRTVHGVVVDLRLRTNNQLLQTITSQMVGLVPGTVVVDMDSQSRLLTLHMLDIGSREEAEEVRRRVLAQEARVIRALDPDPESVLDPRRNPQPSRAAAETTDGQEES